MTEIITLVDILQELESFAEKYPCNCAYNYPGSTEYHGHDCQNDVAQEFVVQFMDRIRNINSGGRDKKEKLQW